MKSIIAAIALVGAAAQNPEQPKWPHEFTANVTETDLRRGNATRVYYHEYSYSNNAVINDFTDYTRRGSDYVVDFNDYRTGRVYFTVTPANGTTFCHANPINGNIPVPPVATFVYNGTEPAGGPGNWPVPTYRWLGQIQRLGDFVYHTTANAAETPVGYYDFTTGLKTAFTGFTAVANWPAGTWTPPAKCN